MPRRIAEGGSSPASYGRPWGGLNVYSGRGCKYIHLVIHDNAQGISFWSGATDNEIYGCIIYDNGWEAPDRGHGHAIYTQNEKGLKTIADCIMTGGYGFSLHAYGSPRAFVDHYLAVGNIVYRSGPFLIGGDRPSRDIRVFDNFLYRASMQIGYSAAYERGLPDSRQPDRQRRPVDQELPSSRQRREPGDLARCAATGRTGPSAGPPQPL